MLVVVHRTGADDAGEFLAILEVIEVKTARVVGRFTWRTTSVKLSGWTPDSRTLLVIASREVPQPGWYPGPASDRIPDGRLVLVPVRGGPVHALRGPAYRNVGWAAPAPDGGSLAFGSGRRHQDTIDPARYRLRLAAADGSAVRTVSSEQVRWTDGAAWSPDSRHLLLVGHGRSGQGHLWLLDRNGDVVRQLARGQFLGDPVWCPGTPR